MDINDTEACIEWDLTPSTTVYDMLTTQDRFDPSEWEREILVWKQNWQGQG